MQKSYLPGELIREIRKRKGIRQSHMQELGTGTTDSQVTLSRIENLRQNPSRAMLYDLLSRVELPYRQFFCPYMEEQPAESFVLRKQIVYLLDRSEEDKAVQGLARELIKKLKTALDLDSGINKQLWLSLKTELDVRSGKGNKAILEEIRVGMKLSYPEFEEDDFNGEVLILNECNLLINLARCYGNMGDSESALRILKRIREGYAKQGLSEMYKESTESEIQNCIVRYLLDKGEYRNALTESEEAIRKAKRLSGSTRMPEAVFLRALALYHADEDRDICMALLRQAYFAYGLLKRSAMQKRVKETAHELLKLDFETYNAEAANFQLPLDFYRFEAGSVLAVENLGELLQQFRQSVGIKQSDVYRGICSRSFYSRIEAGERTGVGIFILEALMQRLGRDIDQYIEYFSSIEEWEESQLRMRYMRELYIGNKDEAEETLKRLKEVGDFSGGLGKQFLLFSQAIMQGARGEYSDYIELLTEAIKMTIPDFSEDTIANTRLTYNECNIINAIANHYAENGEIERGIAMYLGIRESMNRYYLDDSIKARYYLTLLSNLSLEHYNIGRYQEALAFAEEQESISERHGVLFMLNGAAAQKSKCLHMLGREEEAIKYAAMAYYCGSLTAAKQELLELDAYAKNELGVDFSDKLGFVFHEQTDRIYKDS